MSHPDFSRAIMNDRVNRRREVAKAARRAARARKHNR